MKLKKWIPIVSGTASVVIAGAYGFYHGKGIFNHIRFKAQREAVKSYIESREKTAKFSDIAIAGDGWSTVLTEKNNKKYMLYINRFENSYIFSEHELEI